MPTQRTHPTVPPATTGRRTTGTRGPGAGTMAPEANQEPRQNTRAMGIASEGRHLVVLTTFKVRHVAPTHTPIDKLGGWTIDR